MGINDRGGLSIVELPSARIRRSVNCGFQLITTDNFKLFGRWPQLEFLDPRRRPMVTSRNQRSTHKPQLYDLRQLYRLGVSCAMILSSQLE